MKHNSGCKVRTPLNSNVFFSNETYLSFTFKHACPIAYQVFLQHIAKMWIDS